MSTAIPFHGLDPFVLGRTRQQIKTLAGEPDTIREERFADDSQDEIWTYEAAGIELAFSDADDWRLASITLESPETSIQGAVFIGSPVDELIGLASKAGIVDVELADDLDENGLCYTSDANGLMLWVEDGVVASITLFPKYDESGEAPCWPEGTPA